MPDPNETTVVLDVHQWQDAPTAIIDALMAVKTETVTIDASAPVHIGAQIAQLLISAQKTALEGSGTLQIVNASPNVTESLDTLGLSSFFEGVLL